MRTSFSFLKLSFIGIKRRLFCLKHSPAFSMIEFAVAIPVILSMVVATFDVSQIMYANSVARESVETALRCVYTTDSSCQSAAPGTRVALYDVFRSKGTTLNPSQIYSGDFSLMQGPVYSYSATATVLSGGVTSMLAGTTSLNYSTATQNVNYSLVGQKTFGSLSFGATPRNPTASRDADYSVNLTGVDLINDGETDTSNQFVFQLPADLNTSFAAFNSNKPTFTITDGALIQSKRIEAGALPIIFRVDGQTTSANQACAEVTISLVEYDAKGSSSKELGGQLIGPGADSDANFFLRGIPNGEKKWGGKNGIPKDNIVPADWDTYNEFTDHNEVTVDATKKHALTFAVTAKAAGRYEKAGQVLECPDSKSVNWKASKVSVWFPEVQNKTETIACSNIQSACSGEFKCSPADAKFGSLFSAAVSGKPIFTAGTACNNLDSSAGVSALSAVCQQASCGKAANLVSTFGGDPVTAAFSCPTNPGIAASADSSGKIRSAEAKALCPPPAVAANQQVQDVYWTQATTNIGSATYKAKSCLDSPSPSEVNSEWSRYPQLSMNRMITADTHLFATGSELENRWETDTDPAVLVQKDSRYNCGSFSALSSKNGDLTIPANGIFGVPTPLSCSSPSSATLRAQLATLPGVGNNAYIVIGAPSAGEKVAVAACLPCAPCEVTPGVEEKVSGSSPVPANTLPAACFDAGYSCATKFAKFSEGPATTGTVNTVKAQLAADTEMKTFLPYLSRLSCPAVGSSAEIPAGCPSVKIDPNSLDSDTLRATSEIEVPMITGSLFAKPGERSVKVSYSDSRLVEKAFARSR